MGSSRAAALFASPAVVAEPAAGDCLLLRSAEPLGGYPVSVIHSLRGWALEEPDHPLVAERAAGGSWRTCTYGGAVAAADAIGQALLERGLGPDRPLLILSGNGVDHLLVTLGAMTAGIPVALTGRSSRSAGRGCRTPRRPSGGAGDPTRHWPR